MSFEEVVNIFVSTNLSEVLLRGTDLVFGILVWAVGYMTAPDGSRLLPRSYRY